MNCLKPNGTTYRANLNLNHRYPRKLFAVAQHVDLLLTLIRMTKDEKVLAVFKGLLL
jgi:hypothetical protein